jgi:hypothetical protein
LGELTEGVADPGLAAPASSRKDGFATVFVLTVKHRYQQEPEVFTQFLAILRTFQRNQKVLLESMGEAAHDSIVAVARRTYYDARRLFRTNPDLLLDFVDFLPATGEARNEHQLAQRLWAAQKRDDVGGGGGGAADGGAADCGGAPPTPTPALATGELPDEYCRGCQDGAGNVGGATLTCSSCLAMYHFGCIHPTPPPLLDVEGGGGGGNVDSAAAAAAAVAVMDGWTCSVCDERAEAAQARKAEMEAMRPEFSYAQMAARAIRSHGGMATTGQIYAWIQRSFEYYRQNAIRFWRDSVRQNLAVKKHTFVSKPHPNKGVGGKVWMLHGRARARTHADLFGRDLKRRREADSDSGGCGRSSEIAHGSGDERGGGQEWRQSRKRWRGSQTTSLVHVREGGGQRRGTAARSGTSDGGLLDLDNHGHGCGQSSSDEVDTDDGSDDATEEDHGHGHGHGDGHEYEHGHGHGHGDGHEYEHGSSDGGGEASSRFDSDSAASAWGDEDDDDAQVEVEGEVEDEVEVEDEIEDEVETDLVVLRSENFCRVCSDGGELLCCEGCPAVYHGRCATPAVTSPPTGVWLCHVCAGRRMAVVDGGVGGGQERGPQGPFTLIHHASNVKHRCATVDAACKFLMVGKVSFVKWLRADRQIKGWGVTYHGAAAGLRSGGGGSVSGDCTPSDRFSDSESGVSGPPLSVGGMVPTATHRAGGRTGGASAAATSTSDGVGAGGGGGRGGQSSVESDCTMLLNSVRTAVNSSGAPACEAFLTLPSRQLYPDYYEVTKMPISIQQLQRCTRMGVYTKVEQLRTDFKRMVANAYQYNEVGSQVSRDAAVIAAAFKLAMATLRRKRAAVSRHPFALPVSFASPASVAPSSRQCCVCFPSLLLLVSVCGVFARFCFCFCLRLRFVCGSDFLSFELLLGFCLLSLSLSLSLSLTLPLAPSWRFAMFLFGPPVAVLLLAAAPLVLTFQVCWLTATLCSRLASQAVRSEAAAEAAAAACARKLAALKRKERAGRGGPPASKRAPAARAAKPTAAPPSFRAVHSHRRSGPVAKGAVVKRAQALLHMSTPRAAAAGKRRGTRPLAPASYHFPLPKGTGVEGHFREGIWPGKVVRHDRRSNRTQIMYSNGASEWCVLPDSDVAVVALASPLPSSNPPPKTPTAATAAAGGEAAAAAAKVVVTRAGRAPRKPHSSIYDYGNSGGRGGGSTRGHAAAAAASSAALGKTLVFRRGSDGHPTADVADSAAAALAMAASSGSGGRAGFKRRRRGGSGERPSSKASPKPAFKAAPKPTASKASPKRASKASLKPTPPKARPNAGVGKAAGGCVAPMSVDLVWMAKPSDSVNTAGGGLGGGGSGRQRRGAAQPLALVRQADTTAAVVRALAAVTSQPAFAGLISSSNRPTSRGSKRARTAGGGSGFADAWGSGSGGVGGGGLVNLPRNAAGATAVLASAAQLCKRAGVRVLCEDWGSAEALERTGRAGGRAAAGVLVLKSAAGEPAAACFFYLEKRPGHAAADAVCIYRLATDSKFRRRGVGTLAVQMVASLMASPASRAALFKLDRDNEAPMFLRTFAIPSTVGFLTRAEVGFQDGRSSRSWLPPGSGEAHTVEVWKEISFVR